MEEEKFKRLIELQHKKERLKEKYEKELSEKLDVIFKEQQKIRRECDHKYPNGENALKQDIIHDDKKGCEICGYLEFEDTFPSRW